MRLDLAPFAAVLVGAALAAAPRPAAAYEDELTLGLAGGYAWSVANDGAVPRHGVGLDATVGVGLGDTFTLQAHVGWAAHPAEAPMQVVVGGVELVYLVDILEVVPFFGLGLDVFGSFLGGVGAAEAAAHLLLGFDWLLDWEWAVGLDVRVFVLPLADDGRRLDPVYGQVLVRATRRFTL